MNNVQQRFKVVNLAEAKDYGSAGIDFDSVFMGLLYRLAAFFNFGAITGNSVLKIYGGATAGAKTTAIAFRYRLASGDYKATDADGFGSLIEVAATGLTLTATTFDHRQIVVDIQAADMPDGLPWLTIEVSNVATVLLLAALGVGEPRYQSETQVTVI